MLKFLLDKIKLRLDARISSREAVNSVAEEYGISKEGRTYEYLLKRANEMKEDMKRE